MGNKPDEFLVILHVNGHNVRYTSTVPITDLDIERVMIHIYRIEGVHDPLDLELE